LTSTHIDAIISIDADQAQKKSHHDVGGDAITRADDTQRRSVGIIGTSRPGWRIHGMSVVVTLIAVAVIGLRFMRSSDAAFLQDEPVLIATAEHQLVTGVLWDHSPLVSTSGATYGPTPLWFYGGVVALFGSRATTAILATTTAVTAAQLALVWCLARSYRRPDEVRWWAGIGLLAFSIATSPWEYLWSRTAWDLTTNAIPYVVAALLLPRTLHPSRLLVIGALLGLALGSHPMVAPFALGVGAIVLMAEGRWSRRLGRLAIVGLPAGLVLIPYVRFLIAHPAQGGFELTWEPFAQRVIEVFRPASFWRISEVFAPSVPGTALSVLGDGVVPLVLSSALAVVSVVGWLMLVRSDHQGQRRVGALALVTAIGYPVAYSLLGVGSNAHYQFPVAWIGAVGLAPWLFQGAHLGERDRRAVRVVIPIIALVAAINGSVLVTAQIALSAEGGTRGTGYGTTVGQQMAAIAVSCGEESPVFVSNYTEIFESALLQHVGSLEPCFVSDVTVCSGACDAPAGSRDLELRYASDAGGQIVLIDRNAGVPLWTGLDKTSTRGG
jgi:hypothetical protein